MTPQQVAQRSCEVCGGWVQIEGSSEDADWSPCTCDDDKTPWCEICGGMTSAHCDCGPWTKNE